ncbi:TlpA disulfide reductase family protein [Dokdonella sp.]|uniref:TlpA family protein disulfide reductase n=1 Tax=Dokdonella sp. TaxID=2291710 RepID=UPI0027B8E892|nr:TlpA disulfide reductase family protein [Dokdonella sp.]
MKSLLRAMLPCALLVAAAVGAAGAARPQLKITTLDGHGFDLAAQRGNWVIVNYWATWCSPCIKEMPDLSAFVAAHDNVAAIGLAWDDVERSELEQFVASHPVVYPLAQVDLDHPPADFPAPRGLPVTYVIAPDGSVAKTFTGPIDGKDLAGVIEAGKTR